MSTFRTFALIPAGGHSTRMGRPKLTLPLGDRTVIEHVLAALREAAVDQVLVVIGSHVPELAPLAAAGGASVAVLPEPTADMRATVEHGLRWLADHVHPRPEDAWLLVPADHPTLEAEAVRQLLRGREQYPSHSVWVPTFQGRRGHPALITWEHVPGIRSLPAGQGINAYLRQHAEETAEIPVESASVLCDLDLPEDYERLQQTLFRREPRASDKGDGTLV
jgi:molybdenum cofactor cytidylyltransferase